MPANRLPYFPFHVDDYLSDGAVMRMSAEAEGCYIRLLCRSWKSETPGVVPDDLVSEMGALHRVEDPEKVKRQLSVAFDTESAPGYWIQKRMVVEYRKLTSVRKAQGTKSHGSHRAVTGQSQGVEVEVEVEREESKACVLTNTENLEAKNKNSRTGSYSVEAVKISAAARQAEREHERIKAEEAGMGLGRTKAPLLSRRQTNGDGPYAASDTS